MFDSRIIAQKKKKSNFSNAGKIISAISGGTDLQLSEPHKSHMPRRKFSHSQQSQGKSMAERHCGGGGGGGI